MILSADRLNISIKHPRSYSITYSRTYSDLLYKYTAKLHLPYITHFYTSDINNYGQNRQASVSESSRQRL
jgi:hypothetical protein